MQKRFKGWYWFLVLILFGFQTIFIFNSLDQIRYEELAESVRNPFWFQNRLIYDGTSGSIFWYGILASVYNIFGFSLFTAKFVRLFLYLISLLSLAALLKKYFGVKKAVIPLITIGFSPTLLYFNTIQTIGIDLVWLPISLYLLSRIDFKKGAFTQILFWVILMFSWLSYPTVIFYTPALVLIYGYKLFKTKAAILKNVLISTATFFMPLILTFIYITNREWMIYDPHLRNGLFRGAGLLQFDGGFFFRNLNILSMNLFDRAWGYYFELSNVEFSHILPMFSIGLIFYIAVKVFFISPKLRFWVFLAFITLILNIVVISFSIDPNLGIRRYTPVIASIYVLFIICWVYTRDLQKNNQFRLITTLMLIIIPAHHILSFPVNLVHLKDPSYFREMVWFNRSETPQKSLDLAVQEVQQHDLDLICLDQKNQPYPCRYSEIYAAVAGSCLWNRLQCHKILGYDFKTKNFIPLSVELWNTYYFGH
ncbi:hypothetical protein HYW46_01035 [Candidatus Daviesbacteria bacterium]|nr:hypothetical protein [Candidatus Daviesbacteria bacterium]